MRFFAVVAVVLAVVFASFADAKQEKKAVVESALKAAKQLAEKARKSQTESKPEKKVSHKLRKNEKKSYFQTRKPVENYIEVESAPNAARTRTSVAPTGAMFVTATFSVNDCNADPNFFRAVAANECIPDGTGSKSHMYMMKNNKKAGMTSYTDLSLTYSDNVCVDADSAEVNSMPSGAIDTCYPMGNGKYTEMSLVDRDFIVNFRPDAGMSGFVMGTFQNTKSCLNFNVNDLAVVSYFESGFCSSSGQTGPSSKYSCNGNGEPVINYYTDAACTTVDTNKAADTFTSASAQSTCSAQAGFNNFFCVMGASA